MIIPSRIGIPNENFYKYRLYGWGSNSFSLIQPGLVISSPVQVGAWSDWSHVDIGGLGIRSDGSLWSWGLNSRGNRGLGYVSLDVRSPVRVGTNSDWSKCYSSSFDLSYPNHIAYTGNTVSFAVKNNLSLWAFGRNSVGALGVGGSSIDRSSPVQVGLLTDWIKISVGGLGAAGIRNTNNLFSWGSGTSGAIGDGSVNARSSPVQIAGSWIDVSVGSGHKLGIKSDNSIWAWGSNTWGQLGDSTSVSKSSPVRIGSDNNWAKVFAGRDHSLAIKTDGSLWSWGLNFNGQLGLGNTTNRSSPVRVGLLTDWSYVTCGSDHTVALRSPSMSLFSWGRGVFGQIGDTSSLNRLSPVQILSSLSPFKIASGFNSNFVISNDNKLWTWGKTQYATNSLNNDVLSPVLVFSDDLSWSGKNFNICSSSGAAVFKKRKTLAQAWGMSTSPTELLDNHNLKFGFSSYSGDRSSKVSLFNNNNWRYISFGLAHALAIDVNNNLFSWGQNTLGSLGNNASTSSSSPVLISSSGDWSKVFAGSGFSFAIKNDGSLWSWGSNGSGRLGVGDTVHRSSPIRVGLLNDWKSCSVAIANALLIKTDKTLWITGSGYLSLLPGSSSVSSPVLISSSSVWMITSLGLAHAAAITDDGRLFTWGLNSMGQLGNSSVLNTSNLTQIGTNEWIDVSCGSAHTIALKSNGSIWGWGSNSAGQLGRNNRFRGYSSPVLISNFGIWKKVIALRNSSLALKSYKL